MAYVELAYIHNFNLGGKSKDIRNAQIARIRTHAARVTRSRAKAGKSADCHDITGSIDHRPAKDAEQLVPQEVWFHAGLGPTRGDFLDVLSNGDHETVRQAIRGCTCLKRTWRLSSCCQGPDIQRITGVTMTLAGCLASYRLPQWERQIRCCICSR